MKLHCSNIMLHGDYTGSRRSGGGLANTVLTACVFSIGMPSQIYTGQVAQVAPSSPVSGGEDMSLFSRTLLILDISPT